MAMNLQVGRGDEPEVLIDINTTPLIDVMLVLLIMLIITIPVQTHAVKLDLPTGQPPPPVELQEPVVVTIDVDFDGTILWDGNVVQDRATLERQFMAIAHQPVPPEVHIRPNKLAAYKHVAMVLASAQRLGIEQIGLIGNEQFLP